MKSAAKIAQSILATLEKIDTCEPSPNTKYPASISYLKWMCNQVVNNGGWDIDKAHRWVGYVQGVIVSQGFTSLDQERDRVRGLPDIYLYADDGVIWPPEQDQEEMEWQAVKPED